MARLLPTDVLVFVQPEVLILREEVGPLGVVEVKVEEVDAQGRVEGEVEEVEAQGQDAEAEKA